MSTYGVGFAAGSRAFYCPLITIAPWGQAGIQARQP
jgi:hypothetical protein